MSQSIHDSSGRKVGEIRTGSQNAAGLGLCVVIMIPITIAFVCIMPFWAIVDPSIRLIQLERHPAFANHLGLLLIGSITGGSAFLLVAAVIALFSGGKIGGDRSDLSPSLVVALSLWLSWWLALSFIYVKAYLQWLL